MNRRNFLSTLIGGLAATAAVRSFPFRVFSLPSGIVVPQLTTAQIMCLQLEAFRDKIPELMERQQTLYEMFLDERFSVFTPDAVLITADTLASRFTNTRATRVSNRLSRIVGIDQFPTCPIDCPVLA